MSARLAKLAFVACCIAFTFPLTASAQFGGGGGGGGNNNGGGFGNNNQFFNVVGGVKIDTSGVLSTTSETLDPNTRQLIKQSVSGLDSDLETSSKLRMVSLRGLEAAITKSKDEGTPLSKEALYMAGLQRVEFVIVSPENDDIILAGPGEGITVDDEGRIVGSESGTPVIHLEDFLVAMRSTENARTGAGISVSIDPTPEGIQKVQSLFNQLKRTRTPFNPNMQPNVEQAMGDQVIRLTGIPADSRFSQVMVAADYKMKRLSMGLERSPISGFPSFMELVQNAKVRSMTAAPRFWMECNYQPIAKGDDNSVWQIRGQGVKTLTEESKFDVDGKRKQAGTQNKFAQKWADSMTERFEELAEAEPAFRELRNLMDLSVVAAIIRKENLGKRVDLGMPAILGLSNAAVTPSYPVAKAVSAQCSFVRLTKSWLVSASGGVQFDPWGVAGETESADLSQYTQVASNRSDNWWWNAK